MKDESATIESLIEGGLIGAVLGAFLLKDKEEGAVIGAAISATAKANEEARKTDVLVYVEENGMSYEIVSSHEKRFIKNLKKPSQNLPEQLNLNNADVVLTRLLGCRIYIAQGKVKFISIDSSTH